jgi:hypothetical protein
MVMIGKSNECFEVVCSNITFSSVMGEMGLSEERIEELKNIEILALPSKNYCSENGKSFYGATREFYMYCQEKEPGQTIDFCTEKAQYLEIDLNSVELFLGTFLISSIIVPVFVNLISEFIKNKLTHNDDKITINIIINDNRQNNSIAINFRGTKEDFDHKVIRTLSTYSKDGHLVIPSQTGDNLNVLS